MLDMKFVRENKEKVIQGLATKGVLAHDVEELLELDKGVRDARTRVEQLRSERNSLASLGPHAIEQGRKLKKELDEAESVLREIEATFTNRLLLLPNIPEDTVPIGEGESANRIVKTGGAKTEIADATDHMVLAEAHDLIDCERGAKVAGSRFNYLKNEAVILEFALIQYALSVAQKYGHIPMITPELVNEKTVMGTGYLPQGADEVYKTQDDLYLIGTSELALVAYHQNEVFALKELPKRYVGFSSCFRREAGSYGKDTRGIIRQHQFDKVELVSFVEPEQSGQELERILGIEEEIMGGLGFAYEVVEIGTGDLGIQASRKFDINTWMPGQGKYRETHSCSNTTDFQSRRLNIRYKKADGTNAFVHTLNGTAIAIGRMLVAILENGQQPDGTIRIPEVLQPYCGLSVIE
jgi:seryl-tRNA synthetase